MALIKKSYSSFGREDKLSAVKAIAKGDSFIIRIIAFVIAAGIFLLIVEMTHQGDRNDDSANDSTITAPALNTPKPAKK